MSGGGGFGVCRRIRVRVRGWFGGRDDIGDAPFGGREEGRLALLPEGADLLFGRVLIGLETGKGKVEELVGDPLGLAEDGGLDDFGGGLDAACKDLGEFPDGDDLADQVVHFLEAHAEAGEAFLDEVLIGGGVEGSVVGDEDLLAEGDLDFLLGGVDPELLHAFLEADAVHEEIAELVGVEFPAGEDPHSREIRIDRHQGALPPGQIEQEARRIDRHALELLLAEGAPVRLQHGGSAAKALLTGPEEDQPHEEQYQNHEHQARVFAK